MNKVVAVVYSCFGGNEGMHVFLQSFTAATEEQLQLGQFVSKRATEKQLPHTSDSQSCVLSAVEKVEKIISKSCCSPLQLFVKIAKVM